MTILPIILDKVAYQNPFRGIRVNIYKVGAHKVAEEDNDCQSEQTDVVGVVTENDKGDCNWRGHYEGLGSYTV